MSRILISNSEAWSGSVDRTIREAGISRSFTFDESGVYVSAYRKIKIDNRNFFSSGGDFACFCGTMFYDGLFEEKALEKLLSDSADKTVCELRRRMYGSYMVAIKRGDVVRVFSDETNTYKVYYHHADGKFIVLNSYFLIGSCVGVEPDAEILLEYLVHNPLGLKTTLRRIRTLSAKECISIDLAAHTFQVQPCELNDYGTQYRTVDELVSRLHGYLSAISSVKARYLKRPLLFLTGGVDSRLELAADVAEGIRPTLAYWTGNDIIANGTAQDLRIARELAQKRDLPFRQYDVSRSYEDALRDMEARRNRYGEYSAIYAGNSRWYDIFETLDDIDSIELGTRGEALRDLTPLDRSYREKYSMSDFIWKVLNRAGFGNRLFALENAEAQFQRDLLSYADGLDPGNLSLEDAFKLYTCSRFGGSFSISNFSNLFVYSFQIVAQKQVIDTIFSAPYAWLKDSRIATALLERMAKDLLDAPIYSHHRDHIYDPKAHCIRKSLKFRAIDGLKPLLVNTKLYETLYLKFAHKYIRPQSVRNDEIFRKALEILQSSPILQRAGIAVMNPGDWRALDLSAMAVQAAYIHSLDLLAGSAAQPNV